MPVHRHGEGRSCGHRIIAVGSKFVGDCGVDSAIFVDGAGAGGTRTGTVGGAAWRASTDGCGKTGGSAQGSGNAEEAAACEGLAHRGPFPRWGLNTEFAENSL